MVTSPCSGVRRSGRSALDEAHELEALGDSFALVGIDDVARRCFTSHDLSEDEARDVGFGRKLSTTVGEPAPVAVFDPTGRFLALYEQRGEVAAPVAVFV